jgi:threonine synthase
MRFSSFFPLENFDMRLSLGEGDTPCFEATSELRSYMGLNHLYLKNETVNPTWSFKDRGSFLCIQMSRLFGEKASATISTGNMGHSMAAYGKRARLQTFIFLPVGTPGEKILPMRIHGANVVVLSGNDFSNIKKHVRAVSENIGLRTISGNGPLRVEGYKSLAFELYEQTNGQLPDYVVLPVSATGLARGVFKGFRELLMTGLINTLPRLVIVQPENNAPLARPLKQGLNKVIPVSHVKTIATALTTGDPPGGDAFLRMALKNGWLAETASEQEILEGISLLADQGLYAEASSATVIPALKKLVRNRQIPTEARVTVIITGSGLKNTLSWPTQPISSLPVEELEPYLEKFLPGL